MIFGKKLIAALHQWYKPLTAWSDDHLQCCIICAWLANKLHIRELLFTVRALRTWESKKERERRTDTATITTATRCGDFGCHRGVWVCVFFCALSSLSLSLKGKNYTKRKMCVDWSQLPFAAADCRLFILLLWTTSAKCWQVKCKTHTHRAHVCSR